eukprot:TRINITY_DN798_c0_g1_i1.p1 TRINITY_DN798_c0_g1~~TRINITY_DN798_c0_g1_i1.p1  ORF type:complete len:144 (-),score=29.45 TRINITY_DN798_c0_g1_i1:56-487(-)
MSGVIYSFFIFSRKGSCLFKRKWIDSQKETNEPEDDSLLAGMLFAVKFFVEAISPEDVDNFNTILTNGYKLHCYLAPTGYRFVLISKPNVQSLVFQLEKLYCEKFVTVVARNPAWTINTPITPENCPRFVQEIERWVNKLHYR